MPMNALEVAVYAMVLTAAQPKPYECVTVQPQGVNCTNGLAATEPAQGTLAFNSGVQVIKEKQGQVRLTNGMTAFFDASAWVTFKDASGATLISARRASNARFRFSNGYTCEAVGDPREHARCTPP